VAQYPNISVEDDVAVHRLARDSGIPVATLYNPATPYEEYEKIQGVHLLLLAYKSGNADYLKVVNYLGRYVSTVQLDVSRPTCKQLFQAQRIVLIDSNPPYADISLADRKLGEAPLWLWLKDGEYQINCELPEQKFKPKRISVPKDIDVICQREDVALNDNMQEEVKMTGEEKAGSVLIYVVGAIASAAAIILPFLLFK
jgi:hypothetical protein